MEKLEIGSIVMTLVEKTIKETGTSEYKIPKGTIGIVCEIFDDFGGAFVDFWGRIALPDGATGLGDYRFEELRIIPK